MEVPGLDYPLIFAADDQQADELVSDGNRRGAIWTLAELADLIKAPGMTHESAIQAARLRQIFNATVVDIRSCSAVSTMASPEPLTPEPDENPVQSRLDMGQRLRVEPD